MNGARAGPGISVVLCSLADLADPGARGFRIVAAGEELALFVVRRDDLVVAYRNSCPHTRGPLDWVPDQFLDSAGREIQCASHDARFRIADGFCISGPCAGQSLEPLCVKVRDGQVVVELPVAPGRS